MDTAELYENYAHIRYALKLSQRDDILISSKTYAYTKELAIAAVEGARKALDRDVIDIFMLHEQESVHTLNGHKEALDYLLSMKEKGIIRAVGISTHRVSGVLGVTDYFPHLDVIHPMYNKYSVGIGDGDIRDMAKAVKKAHDMGIGIFSMKALGGGMLFRNAEESLSFVLDSPDIDAVAVGMQSVEEIDANIQFFENRTFPEKVSEILKTKKRRLLLEDYCEGCGECVKTCAQHALYLEDGRAKLHPEKCVLCGYCGAKCRFAAIKIV